MKIEMIGVNDIIPYENNPRFNDKAVDAVAKSISEFGFKVPIVLDQNNIIVTGHTRLKAAKKLGLKEVPCIIADDLSEAQIKSFRIIDNKVTELADWDEEKLQQELREILSIENNIIDFSNFGIDVDLDLNFDEDLNIDEDNKEIKRSGFLVENFTVPPFSILDTRQGYWQKRKKEWKIMIGDGGESREGKLSDSDLMSGINSGVSILDPVLAEIINRWFGLEKCKTFDPFAGDSVFGFVSNYIGNYFTGIELRQEQVDLNNSRIDGENSKYICDDGQNVGNHIQENSQDLLFSCPPYFDLEIYSDLPNDASNQKNYQDFINILNNAFSSAIKCLKDNRFAVIIVGDIRDKHGFYYRFVDHIKDIFTKNNMGLYNEMIIIESLGTLPQRVSRYMKNRKIGKCHQNVLVFYKGNPDNIKDIFPQIEFQEEGDDAIIHKTEK